MVREDPIVLQAFADSLSDGREDGLRHFFDKYAAALAYFATRICGDEEEAADIAEECFIRLWEHRASFSAYGAVVSWLYTCARNLALMHLRAEKRKPRVYAVVSQLQPESDTDIQRKIIEAETLREIRLAVEKLPPQCRRIFKMHFFEGKDYQTIAAELGLSVPTIRSQKARAIRLLRRQVNFLLWSFLLLPQ